MTLSYILLLVMTGHMITALPSSMAKLDDIHFPDSDEIEIPESCRNQTYCTIQPKNYPFKDFNEMFKYYRPYAPQPKLVLPTVNINTRGEFDDDCETSVSYDPLYLVRDKRGNEWYTVVQAPEHDYIQSVRVETCKNTGSSCFKHLVELQESYMTYCDQNFNTWKVLVSRAGSKPEEIEAVLPVCCSCRYKPKE